MRYHPGLVHQIPRTTFLVNRPRGVASAAGALVSYPRFERKASPTPEHPRIRAEKLASRPIVSPLCVRYKACDWRRWPPLPGLATRRRSVFPKSGAAPRVHHLPSGPRTVSSMLPSSHTCSTSPVGKIGHALSSLAGALGEQECAREKGGKLTQKAGVACSTERDCPAEGTLPHLPRRRPVSLGAGRRFVFVPKSLIYLAKIL